MVHCAKKLLGKIIAITPRNEIMASVETKKLCFIRKISLTPITPIINVKINKGNLAIIRRGIKTIKATTAVITRVFMR